jgi:hypothetical protein
MSTRLKHPLDRSDRTGRVFILVNLVQARRDGAFISVRGEDAIIPPHLEVPSNR